MKKLFVYKLAAKRFSKKGQSRFLYWAEVIRDLYINPDKHVLLREQIESNQHPEIKCDVIKLKVSKDILNYSIVSKKNLYYPGSADDEMLISEHFHRTFKNHDEDVLFTWEDMDIQYEQTLFNIKSIVGKKQELLRMYLSREQQYGTGRKKYGKINCPECNNKTITSLLENL